MASARSGERSAFAALVTRWQSSVYSLAASLLRDHERALAAARAAFVRAHRELPRLEADARFPSWLAGLALDCARAAREKPSAGAAPRPGEGRNGLGGVLRSMDERVRAALDLRFREDLPVSEIAELLGASPVEARDLLVQGVSRLRTALSPSLRKRIKSELGKRRGITLLPSVLDALEEESTEPLALPMPLERAQAKTDPDLTRKRAETEPYGELPQGLVRLEDNPKRLLGQVLAGYRVDSEIATGGMGTVYRATQLAADRPVALKVLSRRLAASGTYLKRFLREARTAVAIDHPNIIRVYDAGEERGETFFVMELVDGEDAETAMIASQRPFPPARAVAIALEVARALEAAHRAGVIHRDVKPANVLLTKTGGVKLADLGLAKLEESGLPSPDPKLTLRKVVMGSPNYMPPEQAEDARKAEPRSDVFAVGATLFHLVTGVRPFGTGTSLEVIGRVVDPAPLVVPEKAVDGTALDPELRAIIERACAKPLDARYPTATALREALEAWLRKLEPPRTATPAQPIPLPRPITPPRPVEALARGDTPSTPFPPRPRSGKFALPGKPITTRRRAGEDTGSRRRLAVRGDSSRRLDAVPESAAPPAIAVIAIVFVLAIVVFLVAPRREEPALVEPRGEPAPVRSASESGGK